MSLRSVLDPAVGVWLVVSGVVSRTLRPASKVGLLITLAGAAWLADAVVPGLTFAHRGPLAHLHLSYPSGRLRRRAVVAVSLAVYTVSLGYLRLAAGPVSGQTRSRCPAGRSLLGCPLACGCGSLPVCSPPGTADEAWLKRGLPCS